MEDVITVFLDKGIIGASLIVLAFVIIYLQKKQDKFLAQYQELQEKRLEDILKLNTDITEVLSRNAEANRILAEKIEISRGGRQ